MSRSITLHFIEDSSFIDNLKTIIKNTNWEPYGILDPYGSYSRLRPGLPIDYKYSDNTMNIIENFFMKLGILKETDLYKYFVQHKSPELDLINYTTLPTEVDYKTMYTVTIRADEDFIEFIKGFNSRKFLSIA